MVIQDSNVTEFFKKMQPIAIFFQGETSPIKFEHGGNLSGRSALQTQTGKIVIMKWAELTVISLRK